MDEVDDFESYMRRFRCSSAPTFDTKRENNHKNYDLENIERLQEYERNL